MDYTSILMNILIVINEIFDRKILNPKLKMFMIVIALTCLWLRAFYWMRVFEMPAFYILLIKETLIDILPFMLLITMILMLFTNVLYVLNMSDRSLYPSGDPLLF